MLLPFFGELSIRAGSVRKILLFWRCGKSLPWFALVIACIRADIPPEFDRRLLPRLSNFARVRRDTYLLDRLQFATDLRCAIARIFSCLNRVNGAPELFQQHVAEARIGFVDPDVHEFFDAMIHLGARLFDCLLGRRVHGTDSRSPLPRKPMDALPKGSCRRSSFDYDYYARRAVSSRH